jgi:hypothetical protein
MKALVLVLASSAAWILAVVMWFKHDDHAALGFLGLSMVLGNWATQEARRWIDSRRFI